MKKTIQNHKNKIRKRKPKEINLDKQTQSQNDVYTRVTNKILSDLEKGNLTWRKPWNSDHLEGHVMRPLRWNGIPYSGINTLMLWGTAAENDYVSPYWMTFKQALEMKAAVRKGEKGTQVVYADHIVKEEDKDGETVNRQIPFLKSYTVFNASQIEGLPEAYYQLPEPLISNPEIRDQTLELFFAQTKADIYTGTQASYNATKDNIQMPPFECFEKATDFYAVLSHELAHWTKHPKRLDRDFGRKQYGDAGYAEEELVAEIGACMLAADLGIEPMPEEKHAAYIQSWIKKLNNDKKFIFSAAAHAQKAVEFIHSLQPAKSLVIT